jgi:membrane protease YdiL (CAAX protease family)
VNGAIALAASLLVTLAVLTWLGWLGDAGFNSPTSWRDLRVLWPAVLVALFTLSPLVFTARNVTSGAGVAVAVLYAFLTAASKEALNRGLILQALRSYGPVGAALLSALFFGLAHLNNLFSFLSLFVVAQVIWSFLMGVAYAAFRLSTTTIWPLILLHACSDIAIDISLFATTRGESAVASMSLGALWASAIELIVVNLALAWYGLFLLRPLRQNSARAKKPRSWEPVAVA